MICTSVGTQAHGWRYFE